MIRGEPLSRDPQVGHGTGVMLPEPLLNRSPSVGVSIRGSNWIFHQHIRDRAQELTTVLTDTWICPAFLGTLDCFQQNICQTPEQFNVPLTLMWRSKCKRYAKSNREDQ